MTDPIKPFSLSCERNQYAILDVLQNTFEVGVRHVLEIGSGTGQHAVYFAQHFPEIRWQTSDMVENHVGIQMWLEEAQLANVISPVEYQIGQSQWPKGPVDVVFSANTLHIISVELVKMLIQDLGDNLEKGNQVIFYGPFKYQGEFTAASNVKFERWLKNIDPLRGIRDFETIVELMHDQGFTLLHDINMPANNQLLIFKRL